MTRPIALLIALLYALPSTFAAKGPPTAKPLADADCYLELAYLPKERLTGDGEWDKLTAMNLYVPKDGKATHPVVLLVHGGGYGGGDKNEGNGLFTPELAKLLLARGYAVCSLNYILDPAGIFPQVFWDFRSSVRFLRANADRFKLDPEKVAAVGLSAGGWLVTSAGWSDADDICRFMDSSLNISELAAKKWRDEARRKRTPEAVVPLLVPMEDPDPPFGEFSARLNAVSFDFYHNADRISPDDPPINVWGGLGYKPQKLVDACAKAGVDFSVSEITDPKVRPGEGVHVPPFRSASLSIDGKSTITLGERIVEFIDAQLLKNPRALAPEVRPSQRIFADKATVSFVVPKGYVVRYTTDGADPTEASPAFDKPCPLDRDTVVKAMSFAPGRPASGIVTAHFYRAPEQVPPRITAPDVLELPHARVGQPYEVVFKCDTAGSAVWKIGGRLLPYIPFQKDNTVFPLGVKMNPSTGILSGTPDAPGRYWVQAIVGAASGRLAAVRNYLLIVEP